MAMRKCPNGHIYDDKSYSECPLCNITKEKNEESTKNGNNTEAVAESEHKSIQAEVLAGDMLPPKPPCGSDDFVIVDQIPSDKTEEIIGGIIPLPYRDFFNRNCEFEKNKKRRKKKKLIICAVIAAAVIAVIAVVSVICLI